MERMKAKFLKRRSLGPRRELKARADTAAGHYRMFTGKSDRKMLSQTELEAIATSRRNWTFS